MGNMSVTHLSGFNQTSVGLKVVASGPGEGVGALFQSDQRGIERILCPSNWNQGE